MHTKHNPAHPLEIDVSEPITTGFDPDIMFLKSTDEPKPLTRQILGAGSLSSDHKGNFEVEITAFLEKYPAISITVPFRIYMWPGCGVPGINAV